MTWLNDAEVKTAEDLSAERKAPLISQIESQRKEQEAHGVTINGVRYSGSPGNRQALGEALEYVKHSGITVFLKWKDSDGVFHPNHPVSEVQQAYQAIGTRRSELFDKEGEYVEQVEAGTLTDVSNLQWLVA